ncbi:MAG TPA: glutamate formimidoyltransferase [Holophagaceae bacterium]|jgi:glutamate formiminotransferase/formiminotetrahydrofolate cyclodeaminase|nr:glutamate formimidoyltransferase [Holophagaceae bacterium]
MQLIECVPNFSEGRDKAKIKQITDAIEAVAGVSLMDVDPGSDTNRAVVTFVGGPEAALEAAFQGIAKAAQLIDMSQHHGAHPRMGATDVCPFIPVEGVSMEDCAELARRLGKRVGEELSIPVYLYEAAASKPERRNLASVREGEYEALPKKLQDPKWKPDFGPAAFNAKSGATVMGAREFLIAFNITLNSRDKAHATDIAFELREKGRVARRHQTHALYSSGQELKYAEGVFPCGNCEAHDETSFEALETHCRDEHGYDLRHLLGLNGIDASKDVIGQKAYRAGLFAHCKAIGWVVEEYGRAQISVNLTDYKVTPAHEVLDAARELASERGLVITGSEIVGLVPYAAMAESGRHYLRSMGRSPFVPGEDLIKTAVYSMGLADVAPFDIAKKVLGLPKSGSLMAMKVDAFVDEVSRDTPAPGGGSIAALAGALGAALSSMVVNLTQPKAKDEGHELELLSIAMEAQKLKDELRAAVDEDTQAFNGYMDALRLPKNTDDERAERKAAMQTGLKQAVAVPMKTAERSVEAMKVAERAGLSGNPASLTDALVGAQAAFTGVRGGLWNVLINLKDIDDAAFVVSSRKRCESLLKEAEALMARIASGGDARLAAMIDSKKR